MLGYRSYFTVKEVPGGGRLSDVVIQQIYAWLKSKKYAAERVAPGAVATIGKGIEVTLSLEQPDSRAESLYFSLRETSPQGVWVTTIIAHDPGIARKRPWVWVDIDMPRDATWSAPPRIVRSLLEIFDARDGGATLAPVPQRVSVDDVPDLLDAITDAARRGPVFVAGGDTSLPMGPWLDYVGELLRQTTGLASGYVLDPEATQALAAVVGPWHQVAAGTLRAFMNDVTLGDEVDGRRHRHLSTERLVGDTTHRMRRFLGSRARELALATPIPRAAVRVEERMLQQLDLELLDMSTGAVDLSAALSDLSHATASQRPVDATTRTSERSTEPEPDLLEALGTTVASLLGADSITTESIAQLVDKLSTTEKLRRLLERKDRDFAEQFNRMTDLREDHQKTTEQLSDMGAEYWLATAELQATTKQLERNEKEVQRLRIQLQEVGRGEVAWSQPAEPAPVEDPESFEELLTRFGEHERLIWTGKSETTLELDAHDPATVWAIKTWTVLRALNSYAQMRVSGDFGGSIDMYLQNTPPGCASYSSNMFARDENDDVKNTDKFWRPRTLPGPGGSSVFMGAHFKIAKYGTVSPRLHLHDAVAEDGRVYVGYIGPHLPLRTGG
jgi:hypothetical protein